jgi:hypothetical protein
MSLNPRTVKKKTTKNQKNKAMQMSREGMGQDGNGV